MFFGGLSSPSSAPAGCLVFSVVFGSYGACGTPCGAYGETGCGDDGASRVACGAAGCGEPGICGGAYCVAADGGALGGTYGGEPGGICGALGGTYGDGEPGGICGGAYDACCAGCGGANGDACCGGAPGAGYGIG